MLNRAQSEGRALRRVFADFEAAVAVGHGLSIAEHEQATAIEAMLAKLARDTGPSHDDEVERAMVEAIVAEWDADGTRPASSPSSSSSTRSAGTTVARPRA